MLVCVDVCICLSMSWYCLWSMVGLALLYKSDYKNVKYFVYGWLGRRHACRQHASE